MGIDRLTLIRAAHLYADVLSELKYRDGWLSFEPEFAKFVIDRKIEWWELCENSRFRYAEKSKGLPLLTSL